MLTQCGIPATDARYSTPRMGDMKIIKRYSNRKLYDTEQSSYVTLDEIAEMVRSGDELQIVDNKTGNDLTRVTLAQIVFENEKKEKKGLSLQALRLIVQSPAELLTRLRSDITALGEQTVQQVDRFRTQAKQQQDELVVQPLQNLLQTARTSVDELQELADEKLKATSQAMMAPLSSLLDEVHDLRERLERLESRIASAIDARRSSADDDTAVDEATAAEREQAAE